MSEFDTYAEQQAEKAESLRPFLGIKLLKIKESVKDLLSLIGRGDIFDEYTKHDISHIDEMLNILEWLIPEETKKIMSPADWMMLVLSIYFHDLGMLVTKSEYENRLSSDFREYKKNVYDGCYGKEFKEKVLSLGEETEKFLYQEYVRANHATRIKNWISGINIPHFDERIIGEINNILSALEPMFRNDLAKICESHHMDDLDDYDKYKTCCRYGQSVDSAVNLHYIAIILRTADLLHITSDRTPSIQYRVINPRDPKSIIEWQKQMAVRAIRPKIKIDEDGKALPSDTLEVTAYFTQAEAFFGLDSYLIYAKTEIKKSYDLVQSAIKTQGTVNYNFPWRYIDDENVQTNGFERKLFEFNINQNSILNLLVGHTLYNDTSVVLRELTQNGLDAIKLQNIIETQKKMDVTAGRILITWDSNERKLTFSDNGTGMNLNDIENYLLKVGSSKYRSEEFLKQFPEFSAISRFGIGILTCFLIANDIDIITNSIDEESANVLFLRQVHGKYLLKKLSKTNLTPAIKEHGTEVTLFVRTDVDMKNLESSLRKWILIPYCDVYLKIDEWDPCKIGYSSPKEALENYLNPLPPNEYRVVEAELSGVSIAYALKYLKYLNEWDFVTSSNFSFNKTTPIGTCIEGIRVESHTPGYSTSGILALVNVTGNIAKTNVARSAIEINDSKKALLSIVYKLFAAHIQKQIENLTEEYSLTWAANETKYLMTPLLPYKGDDSVGEKEIIPDDDKLLYDELNNLKCLIVENENVRKALSPNEIKNLDEISIIDSAMIRTAECLLRESKTKITLCGLINTIYEEHENVLNNTNNIICNFDMSNILHQNALTGKQVIQIDVSKSQRRIKLVYKNDVSIWTAFAIHLRSIGTLHIPNEQFEIKGLAGEVGVKTINGLYLNFNHKLSQYVISKLHCFNYKNDREDKILLDLFLACVFDRRSLNYVRENKAKLTEEFLESYFERNTPYRRDRELSTKLWSRIEKDELIELLFKEEYQIYDPSNWSRNNT